MLPNSALRLLVRLKLRAALRAQRRRMKTPRGMIVSIVGGLALGVWIFGLAAGQFFDDLNGGRSSLAPEPEAAFAMAGLLCAFLLLLTVVGALAHRGLYLPREEIERLFSAPVSRQQLVRYRLTVNIGRSALAGLLVGWFAGRHAPEPLFGFLTAFVGMATLPVVGQAASILGGFLQRRWAQVFSAPRLVLVLVFAGGFAWISTRGSFGDADWRESGLTAALEHPTVQAVAAVFSPWARAASATEWSAFLPWWGLSIALLLALFELTARLPVDFRELSLETSANVADRLQRMRRGGGLAAGAKASARSAGWRVPWLFGDGPAGAVAWRKTSGMVRKARGTLLVSGVVVAFLVWLASLISRGEELGPAQTLGSATLVGALGTAYLCGGLRFDFRDDLDRMEDILAWPLSAARLFLAMLLPEVVLVSGLLVVGILVQAILAGHELEYLLPVVVALPWVVLAWVAIDNAVFLFAPVRLVPGQEGALHNAGRAIVLLFVRVLILTATGLGVSLAAWPTWWVAREHLDVTRPNALLAAAGAGLLVLIGLDVALVRIGGAVLRRFDPSRDRG